MECQQHVLNCRMCFGSKSVPYSQRDDRQGDEFPLIVDDLRSWMAPVGIFPCLLNNCLLALAELFNLTIYLLHILWLSQ